MFIEVIEKIANHGGNFPQQITYILLRGWHPNSILLPFDNSHKHGNIVLVELCPRHSKLILKRVLLLQLLNFEPSSGLQLIDFFVQFAPHFVDVVQNMIVHPMHSMAIGTSSLFQSVPNLLCEVSGNQLEFVHLMVLQAQGTQQWFLGTLCFRVQAHVHVWTVVNLASCCLGYDLVLCETTAAFWHRHWKRCGLLFIKLDFILYWSWKRSSMIKSKQT